jgi:colanic acid/amylovoran biosynthesis glycosyltransferase
MNILYVVSQYPSRSETFIAREIQHLVDRGHDAVIARLRWSDTGEGEHVDGATVFPIALTPLRVIRGIAWGNRKRPQVLREMVVELWMHRSVSVRWIRLVLIALAALAIGHAVYRSRSGHPAKIASPRSSKEPSRDGLDHIRAHFLDSEAIAASWVARLLQVPYSITAQTTQTRFPDRVIERVIRQASFCVATTDETRRFLERDTDCRRIVLIRSGVEVSTFSRRPSTRPLHDPPRLLAVGRLVPKKGFDVLIESIHQLERRNRSVLLEIIGAGPVRDHLHRQIRRRGLEATVFLEGPKSYPDVRRRYAGADLFVMPSRVDPTSHDRDGLPNVLIEASAAALPVVATRLAGIPELVEAGVTGTLVPPNDAAGLARAIEKNLDAYPAALAMAKNARTRVEERYSLDREVERLERWILTARSRTPPSS